MFALLACRPGGTRTLDPLIKSQLLCQLSYGPEIIEAAKIIKLMQVFYTRKRF